LVFLPADYVLAFDKHGARASRYKFTPNTRIVSANPGYIPPFGTLGKSLSDFAASAPLQDVMFTGIPTPKKYFGQHVQEHDAGVRGTDTLGRCPYCGDSPMVVVSVFMARSE